VRFWLLIDSGHEKRVMMKHGMHMSNINIHRLTHETFTLIYPRLYSSMGAKKGKHFQIISVQCTVPNLLSQYNAPVLALLCTCTFPGKLSKWSMSFTSKRNLRSNENHYITWEGCTTILKQKQPVIIISIFACYTSTLISWRIKYSYQFVYMQLFIHVVQY